MKRKVGILVLCVVSLFVGIAIGHLSSRSDIRYSFRTVRAIELHSERGEKIGVLPSGSILVSDQRIDGGADFAWWGYTPIYFSSGDEATRLGVVQGKGLSTVADIHLNAAPLEGSP